MRQTKPPSHLPIINRLSRLDGHLRGVILMLRDKDRSPVAVAQQMLAVEVALASAKHEFVHAHVQHCIDQRDVSGGALRELKQLTKFL